MKQIIITNVPEDLHKAIKLQAVSKGITLRQLIINLMMDAIKKGGK